MALLFATRPSALARWQTQWVMQALKNAWPSLECRESVITTQGDRILDRPLPEIGGKGLFTQELEEELLSGRMQAAVHSLKDLPIEEGTLQPAGNSPRLLLGAIPPRAEARDALVSKQGHSLDSLPKGARVGTSSLRRAAQLLAYRPDLTIASLRGNVDTRVRKALEGQYDAIILAGAGLLRLGLEANITEWLPFGIMLPAPGQGALAVQCRGDDEETRRYLAAIEDPAARRATTAERAFLAGLGGGCSLPVAAYAQAEGERLYLTGVVAAPDGGPQIRLRAEGNEAYALGQEMARQALAEGAAELLNLVKIAVNNGPNE